MVRGLDLDFGLELPKRKILAQIASFEWCGGRLNQSWFASICEKWSRYRPFLRDGGPLLGVLVDVLFHSIVQPTLIAVPDIVIGGRKPFDC